MQTWKDGLTAESAISIYKEIVVNSAVDVFKSTTPILGILAQDSPEKTSALIEFMIMDLQNFLNVPRTMNEFQIRETARLIMQRYNYMKIADCKHLFDQIKTGQIKLYEGLDGSKILGVFEAWAEERWQSADHYNYNRHLEVTGSERANRDKPFLIGNPDAPDPKQIENYMKTVSNFFKNK